MSDSTLSLKVDDSQVVKAAKSLDNLKKAGDSAATATDKLSKNLNDVGRSSSGRGVENLEQSFNRLNAAIRGYGVYAIAQEILKTADAATLSAARLGLVVNGVTELARAQRELFEVSQNTRTAIGSTTNLFVSLSRSLNTLGVSQQRVLNVTETINKALVVSGSSAQSAAAALIQLGQGFASGTLQGEELRSVLEQTPRLAQAIADGLGVPLGALRKLGSEGQLTAIKVFKALEKSAQDISTEFGAIPTTVSGAFQQVENSFTRLVQIINDTSGATGGLASLLTDLSKFISDVAEDLNRFSKGADDVGVLAEAFYTVYETLKVLGANVSFVFKAIGREIGAVAAQVKLLFTLDPSAERQYRQIREDLIADNIKAAEKLEEFEKKTFGERKARREQERKDIQTDARRLLNEAEGRYPKKSTPDTGGKKDKKSDADRYLQQLEDQLLRTKDLTVQEEALEKIQSGRLGKVTEATKAKILAAAAAIDQVKQEQAAEKEAANVAKERSRDRQNEEKAIAESIEQTREAFRKSLASVEERTQKLDDEEKAAKLAAEANISLAEAVELVAIERLREVQLAKYIEGSEPYLAVEREIEAREKLLQLIRGSESRKGEEKAAEETAKNIQREYDRIAEAFTDALLAGGKSFKDYMVGLLRTLVFRPILDPIISPIAGILATAGSTASAGQSAFGAASQGVSMFTAGKSLYDGFVSGFSGISATAQNTAVQAGLAQYGGYSTNAALIEAQAGAQGYGAAAGTVGANGAGSTSVVGSVASAAAGVIAGIYGGRAISGGYAAFGGSGNGTVNVGTTAGAIIGAFFGMPGVGAAVGGAIGGIINRAFGLKAPEVVGQSIQGDFTGGNFSGNTVTDIIERGGWFRGDRTSQQMQAITGDLDKALDEGGRQITELAKKYGEALGLPVDSLANVTQKINIKLGDDADANQKAVEEALKSYADALLEEFAPALESIRLSGETTAQVLERVGSNLIQVNDLFDLLGLQLLDTSVAGGTAATKLVGIFGSLSELGRAGGAYYDKFYTQEEKVANLTNSLTEEFSKLGYTLPDSRDAFRDLVEAQDTSTDAGLNTIASLLKLSGAFDSLQTALDETTKAAEKEAAEAAKKEADRIIAVAKKSADLQIEYLRAVGNETAAVAAERERELAALRELDPALESVQRLIYEAIDAAAEAERNANVVSGADAVIGDFLSGQQLIDFKTKRIGEILAGGGIESSPLGIISSTRDDIVNLWNSVGTAGREAILDALGLWNDLDELVNGTSRRVAEYRRGTLADNIEQARLASLSPSARIARLKATEARLFGALSTSSDPVAVAEELQGVILQRLQEEAKLRGDVNDTEKEALERRLDGAKRLRQLSDDIFQFVGSLQSSSLSPLSAKEKVAAAQRLFDSTLAKAEGGDANAQSNLLGNARSLIEAGNAAFGSGPQAAAIFNAVTGALEKLGATGAALDPQIAAYQTQIDNLPDIEENTANMLPYLESIDNILAQFFGTGAAAPAAGGSATVVTETGTNGVLTGASVSTSAASGATVAGSESNSFNAFLASVVANTAKINDLVVQQGNQIVVLRDGFAQMNMRLVAIEGYEREQATRGRMTATTSRV